MKNLPQSVRTALIWIAAIWLVASSAADLVLLNVFVVTGRFAGAGGVDLFAGGAWVAALFSAVLLLIAGLRVRRLDRAVAVILAWGSTLAAVQIVLGVLSASDDRLLPTLVPAVPRLAAALLCLGLVLGLKRDPAPAVPQG